jgi:CDP-paratose 2-epimerase
MSVVVVTGSAGLVGSETVRFYCRQGYDVVGIDNDMRRRFFGDEASTTPTRRALEREHRNYTHVEADIREWAAVHRTLAARGKDIVLVVHTAAQPSHDWAARQPHVDFAVNACGTLNVLEACRQVCPEAVVIFTSTNKVYGDLPNSLPLVELETRWELPPGHPWFEGIDETMSIDRSTHSLFGVSKVAADLMAQEYGRNLGLKTGVFRGGCLTGPGHAGAELHGFLAYLVKCAVSGKPYRVIGHKGKQVRDNIHAHDLVRAFDAFFRDPRPGEVYNIGGGRFANVSLLEAVGIMEELTGRRMTLERVDEPRTGDHIWWVSDTRKFRKHYPVWSPEYDIRRTLDEIHTSQLSNLTFCRAG